MRIRTKASARKLFSFLFFSLCALFLLQYLHITFLSGWRIPFIQQLDFTRSSEFSYPMSEFASDTYIPMIYITVPLSDRPLVGLSSREREDLYAEFSIRINDSSGNTILFEEQKLTDWILKQSNHPPEYAFWKPYFNAQFLKNYTLIITVKQGNSEIRKYNPTLRFERKIDTVNLAAIKHIYSFLLKIVAACGIAFYFSLIITRYLLRGRSIKLRSNACYWSNHS